CMTQVVLFFFSSRRRHTRLVSDWNSDVCSSDLEAPDTMIRISPPVSSAGEGMPLLRSPGASPEPRKPRVLKGIQSQLMLMTRLDSRYPGKIQRATRQSTASLTAFSIPLPRVTPPIPLAIPTLISPRSLIHPQMAYLISRVFPMHILTVR